MGKTPFILAIFLVVASTYVDYGMSYSAISTGRYYEANSFARWYVDHPALAIPIVTVGNYGVGWALSGLWDQNKTLAWILVGALCVLKGYILIHNFKVLR